MANQKTNAPRPLPGNAEAASHQASDPLNVMGGNATLQPPLVDVEVDAAGTDAGIAPPENPMGEFRQRPKALVERDQREAKSGPRMPMPEPASGEATEDPHLEVMSDEAIEKEIRERWGLGAENKRIRFGEVNQRLPSKKRRGFHRHVFNDYPGRIAQAERAGYKHVTDERGAPIVSVVGTSQFGGPLNGYLMEIPEEWFRKDMAAAQAELDEIDQEIRGGRVGKKEGDGRYDAGIKVERPD
jgi:hypothetical protein